MVDERISIFIVDDEQPLLEIYKEVFELEGFSVLTTSSAFEALELYRNNLNIRLIISDSHMTPMSGVEFLKELKSTYQTIPLFYLLTGSIEQSEEDIKLLGGHSLILKPFGLDEILIKIKRDLQL